jgi:hypothetical protein
MRYSVSIGLLVLFVTVVAISQDSRPELAPADLEAVTRYFQIVDGKFGSEGMKYLTDEFGKHQFVLLGEYHDSPRISEFTGALIPILHQNGLRTFALEIGPVSAEMLNEMATRPDKLAESLNALNSRFVFKDGRRSFTPIPFFSNVEDAAFLRQAADRRWKLIGLDQEFSFGYAALMERMYANLGPGKREELREPYARVIKLMKELYAEDLKPVSGARPGNDLYSRMLSSSEVNAFLDKASAGNAKNRSIAAAIRRSAEIYRNNATRKYYAANSGRIAYMKERLREGFVSSGFDARKDKMLVKIGGVHAGRGFSPLSLFEIGNTLNELAESGGKTSLHVNFGSRYYTEGGSVVDSLSDKASYSYRFFGLAQMAKKDQWTVIDLRPLREVVFYHRRFKIDEVLLDLFRRYDLYIIPPAESDPTPNYKAQ